MQPTPLPLITRNEISLGMLGCTSGNGRPYSWSAIFNGYDRELMQPATAGIRGRDEGGVKVKVETFRV
ncbi:MAG: hypothetical protein ACYC7E_12660 [Armatimonadota bacterium]